MDTRFAGKSLLYCAVLAFGPGIPIMAQDREIAPPPGDALLLCTDGLYKHVRRQRLEEVLQSGRSSQQIRQTLIDEANSDGGSDNITVVVARFCADTENECEDTAHASDELELDLALADTGDYIQPAGLDKLDVAR